MHRSRDIYAYVMYYIYVTSGPSLLIESTDSMMYGETNWPYLKKEAKINNPILFFSNKVPTH